MKKFESVLLACDMDGTLLDSDRRISPRNEQALRHFTEQGGLFSLATGRAPKAILAYLPQLPFNAPYSLLNGSLVMDEQHNVLRCAGMPADTKELISVALSTFSQIGCEIFVDDRILIRQMGEVTAEHLRILKLDYEMVAQDELGDTADWCKINLTGDPAVMRQLRELLQPYADRFCISSSMPSFCEITALGVHKGTALRSIAARCGVAEQNIYAVGDSYNDEMMLRTAHIGFAPQNAEADIVKVADVVVCDNNRGAVADAVEWLDKQYT